MDGGAWWAALHGGHKELDMAKHACERVHIHTHACVPRNTYYLEFALTYFSNGKKKEKPGNRR